MRRLLAPLAVAAAALAVGVGSAGATNECRGLQVCVPVTGPWVVVPTRPAVPRPSVQFQLSCPKGYIVGGTDAELTSSAIDLSFLGALGAPVNPGITTARDLVFLGSFVGGGSPTVSFRPHLGCMPASGGGGRVPTSARAFVPPGKPTLRRVRNVQLTPRQTTRVVQGCARGEHLVDAHVALAFNLTPPTPALVRAVTVSQAIDAGRVVVTAHASGALGAAPALVQVDAVCAGGK